MHDRIPTQPSRVKLTYPDGQTELVKLERADDPTDPGTPLNKATLLKDSTAALYGLGVDAVPDDALSILTNAALAQTDTVVDMELFQDWLPITPFPTGLSKDYSTTYCINGVLYKWFTSGSQVRVAWLTSEGWQMSNTVFSNTQAPGFIAGHEGVLYLLAINTNGNHYHDVWKSTDNGLNFSLFVSGTTNRIYRTACFGFANGHMILVCQHPNDEYDNVIIRINLSSGAVTRSASTSAALKVLSRGSKIVYKQGVGYYVPCHLSSSGLNDLWFWDGSTTSAPVNKTNTVSVTGAPANSKSTNYFFELDGRLCSLIYVPSSGVCGFGYVSDDMTTVSAVYTGLPEPLSYSGSAYFGSVFKLGSALYFLTNSKKIYKSTNAEYTSFIQVGTMPTGDNGYLYKASDTLVYTPLFYTEHAEINRTYLYSILGEKLTIPNDAVYGGVKVVSGSYIGTGTYNSGGANKLVFDFNPKIVIVTGATASFFAIFLAGATKATSVRVESSSVIQPKAGELTVTFANGTLTWYYSDISYQGNTSGSEYKYVAIG